MHSTSAVGLNSQSNFNSLHNYIYTVFWFQKQRSSLTYSTFSFHEIPEKCVIYIYICIIVVPVYTDEYTYFTNCYLVLCQSVITVGSAIQNVTAPSRLMGRKDGCRNPQNIRARVVSPRAEPRLSLLVSDNSEPIPSRSLGGEALSLALFQFRLDTRPLIL